MWSWCSMPPIWPTRSVTHRTSPACCAALRHKPDNAAQASDAYASALNALPTHAGAQLASALLLYKHQQYAQALPLLSEQVDPDRPGVPLGHLLALIDCLRQSQDFERA